MPAHILIVELDPAIATMFEDLLQEEGYRTTRRTRTELELLDITQLQPNVILAEAPPFSRQEGLEQMQRFQQFRLANSTPIVVATSSAQHLEDIVQVLEGQQVSVLFKPFEVEELFATIRNFLDAEFAA